ncbi:GGDEF domain-containing protein [Mycoplasmatota bacterium]|nr:GGDEF domain-containing protein [Mycoplasmatota bacterium]
MILGYIAKYSIDIIAMLMLLALFNKRNLMDDIKKKAMKTVIILSIILIVIETMTLVFDVQDAQFRTVSMIFNMLGFMLTPILPLALVPIFAINGKRTSIYVYLASIVNAIFVLLTPWFGLIFSINSDNVYSRGNFFIVFILVCLFNIIYVAILAYLRGKKKYFPIRWRLIGLAVFTILGASIQILYVEIRTTWHTISIALFLFYILLNEFESNFDSLTGLFNRLAFTKTTISLTEHKAYSVIVMDINDFKEINDLYGHQYGDYVLKEISSIIDETSDRVTSSYRIGGDEFCTIVMSDSEKLLNEKVQYIVDKLAIIRKQNEKLPILSIGYVIKQEDDIYDFNYIFDLADKELYKQKQEI